MGEREREREREEGCRKEVGQKEILRKGERERERGRQFFTSLHCISLSLSLSFPLSLPPSLSLSPSPITRSWTFDTKLEKSNVILTTISVSVRKGALPTTVPLSQILQLTLSLSHSIHLSLQNQSRLRNVLKSLSTFSLSLLFSLSYLVLHISERMKEKVKKREERRSAIRHVGHTEQ